MGRAVGAALFFLALLKTTTSDTGNETQGSNTLTIDQRSGTYDNGLEPYLALLVIVYGCRIQQPKIGSNLQSENIL